jgi:hypothetical protein
MPLCSSRRIISTLVRVFNSTGLSSKSKEQYWLAGSYNAEVKIFLDIYKEGIKVESSMM